jgi:hypothetical protein
MMLWEKQTGRRARRWPIGLILSAAFVAVPPASIVLTAAVGIRAEMPPPRGSRSQP